MWIFTFQGSGEFCCFLSSKAFFRERERSCPRDHISLIYIIERKRERQQRQICCPPDHISLLDVIGVSRVWSYSSIFSLVQSQLFTLGQSDNLLTLGFGMMAFVRVVLAFFHITQSKSSSELLPQGQLKMIWRICKDLLIPLVVLQWLLQSIGVGFEDESLLCVCNLARGER